MVGLYGLFTICVQMQKPTNPHLKFYVKFVGEFEFRSKEYTIKDNIAWSRVKEWVPCGYMFPPINSFCEVKTKNGWESCEIVAHNNLVLRLLRTGDLLVLDPAYAVFRSAHPVFQVLKDFGIETTDELVQAIENVIEKPA